MKRKNLIVLTALLLMSPTLIGCGEVNNGTNIEENEKPGDVDKPNEGEDVTPEDKPSKPEGDNTNPDTKPETDNPATPTIESRTLKEADDLCVAVGKSYKEKFDNEHTYKIKGTVLVDYAISGYAHFMVLTDGTTILPIMIPANKVAINKYLVGNTYEVVGNPGSFRNVNCFKVSENPTRCEKEEVSLSTLTKASTITEVYDEAYKIVAEDNDAGIQTNLYSFKATYLEKINSNLFTVFDGTKHIIIHGDEHVTNGLTENNIYEFTVMPTVHQGKKGCEFVSKKVTADKDLDILNKIKTVAIDGNITALSKTDRYDDKKLVYPFIFKTNCYISGLEKDGKVYFCLVDDPLIDVYYQKNVNERPSTIFIKNHVIKNNNGQFSDLTPYYLDDIKGEFYFYITNYQSEYHAFQGQVINGLINKIQTQN